MHEYGFEIGATDLSVALDCEGDRAAKEGMKGTAGRQKDSALHVRNAVHHMEKHCPPGHRVATKIVVSYVPAVNPYLRDDVREGRA